MMNAVAYAAKFFVDWRFADSVLKYCILFLFWSLIGFWLFRLVAEYIIYWFAITSGIRAPAEGVSFIRILAGFFYVVCVSCFISLVLLTYPIRRARRLFRSPEGANQQIVTGYNVLVFGFLVLYPSALYLTGIVTLKGSDLVILIVPVAVVLATHTLSVLEERFSYSLVRAVLISSIYVVMTVIFGLNVVNGQIFRLTNYGGGIDINIKTKAKDGDCTASQDGNLRLRTNDFLIIASDALVYREIPIKDVCELTRLR